MTGDGEGDHTQWGLTQLGGGKASVREGILRLLRPDIGGGVGWGRGSVPSEGRGGGGR